MTKEKKPRFELKGSDEFFTTQKMRDEAVLAKIHEIDVNLIDQFPKHPYRVKDDQDMLHLMESIKEHGVMTPAIIRTKDSGRYEMISGHRRLHACKLLGMDTIRCEIRELTRDEATVFMVDSNLHRTEILPSEKAFAYKMRLDAMKRQGKRMDVILAPVLDEVITVGAPVEHKSTGKKSRDILAAQVGESREQIRRYIHLTELVPEILQMVDDRRIAFRPAVEISYLSEEQQYTLLEAMEYSDATPSLAQAIKMKKFMQENKLTDEVIQSIMEEEKPNQREKPAFRDERITKLIPKSVPRGQESDFVVKALEFYNRHLQRQRSQER